MSARVLIADPDESLLRSYRETLQRYGFTIATAVDGMDCLAALRWFRPDVLVLELDMPWGGGVGILDIIHDDHDVPPMPVMVLTGRRDLVENLDVSIFFDLVSVYHVKPLAPEQLALIIRRILDDSPRLSEVNRSTQNRCDVGTLRAHAARSRDATPVLCQLAGEAEPDDSC